MYRLMKFWRHTKDRILSTKNMSRCISVHMTAQQSRIKKHSYVTCDTYVTLTDGTGVVHIAPAFGEDDAKVGRKYDMPFVQLVDEKGEMGRDNSICRYFREESRSGSIKRLGRDEDFSSTHRSSSTAIHTAGDVTLR